MPVTTSSSAATPRLPSPTESSPLLRARYSNGYNDPPPQLSPAGGSGNWNRLPTVLSNATIGDEIDGGQVDMPSLMSFISLLPPPREMTYSSMERVLPAGLSPSANGGPLRSRPISPARKTSFILASLLWLYLHPVSISIPRGQDGIESVNGTWDIWRRLEDERKGRRVLLNLIARVWNDFAEGGPSRAGNSNDNGSVEEVLWTEIPMEEDRRQTIRVVDLASSEDAPAWFLSHPLVMISLKTTWSYGVPRTHGTGQSIWTAFDRFSTPRITHAVFLLHHLIYLFLLARLVLAPPSSPYYSIPTRKPGYIEYYVFIYSVTAIPLTQSPTLSILPYAFVALALGLAYPGTPTPNTNTHALLLLSLSLFLLQLHLPNPAYIPTPLYLFDPKRVLPLATLVKGLIKRAVRPAIFFFGPVTLVVGIIFAQALSDTFPLVGLSNGINIMCEKLMRWLELDDSVTILVAGDVNINGPSHPQTRITLLFLFISAFAAMITLVNCLVILFPGSVSGKGALEDHNEGFGMNYIEEFGDVKKEDEEGIPRPIVTSTGTSGTRIVPPTSGVKLQPEAASSTAPRSNNRHSAAVRTDEVKMQGNGGAWGRYGPATALSAKRSFVGVIRRYQHLRIVPSSVMADNVQGEGEDATHPTSHNATASESTVSGTVKSLAIRKPYGRVTLPPVFNLLVWVLGSFPATVARAFSRDSGSPNRRESDDPTSRRDTTMEEGTSSTAVATPTHASLALREKKKRQGASNWAERWEGSVTRLVWRVVVGLPGLVIGGVWIWN